MVIKRFKTKSEVEFELCKKIVSICETSIQKFGNAHLLLSGGSTPLGLYTLFGQQNIDFSKIQIGLVDERYVPFSSEYNNQRNIQEAFNKLTNKKIKVLGMAIDMEDNRNNIQLCSDLYQPFNERIDFCLLGIGEDGHTASIFPNDPASDKLLTQKEPGIFYSNAPNFPNNRISCNKVMLLNAKQIALMLVGEKKIEILKTANEQNLPISHFTNSQKNINVYLSEK